MGRLMFSLGSVDSSTVKEIPLGTGEHIGVRVCNGSLSLCVIPMKSWRLAAGTDW